ncbi:SDR family oxidoreductase [Pleurocapsa sp. FMAR1]|uniref:SDR family oxidoreductase n=1 Tax=Pleurocapsa sp. FMAR1 TaxID=3040204 RepID=UPI0029C709BF|nr:SDR family oxidoreductase [Pleurocapsa sp. FMAR1]
MTKKVVLITGANKGIGYEVARQLADNGFIVLLGARDPERGEAAAKKLRTGSSDVHFVPLNTIDEQSIQSAAEMVTKKWEKVDVLVNNAGIFPEYSLGIRPSLLEVSMLKDTFETNVFGSFGVIHYFLPLLKKAVVGQIVNVSSTLGSLGSMTNPDSMYSETNTSAYNASKSALNALTVALAKDLLPEQIRINSICPGWVQTDLGTDAAPRTVEQGATIIVKLAMMEHPPTGKFLDDDGEIPW